MKNFSFTFLFFVLFSLFFNQIFAQADWDEPIAITDSVTDNTNPLVVHSGSTTLLFYEKIDNGQSSIYMQNINDLHNEIALFSEEGVNYRNPQAIVFDDYPAQPDTMFYLFFESDMEASNIFNIYYTKYYDDGQFSEIIPLLPISYTSSDEMKASGHNLVWKRGVELNSCYYENHQLTQIQTLDFDDAQNIDIGNNTLAFKKYNNDHIELYFSEKSENGNYWEEPESLFIGDNNSTIVLNSDREDFGDYGIVWESLLNNQYTLFSYDTWWQEWDTLEYTSPNPMQTTMLSYEIAIGENKYPYFTEIAMVLTENNNQDIFAYGMLGKTNLNNISNSPYEESNPKLFFYYQSHSYNVVLTWESNRNNHQQLFLTKESFYVNTDEIELKNNKFSIFPNPTSSQINIKLSELVNSDYQIELLDIHHKTIAKLYSGHIEPEETISLNIPHEVANGVYFIRLSSKDFTGTQKLLIAR